MRGKPRKTRQGGPRPTTTHTPSAAVVNGTAGRGEGGPRRKGIVVVEDTASFGGLLVALLREEGYRALRAWDAREAVKMARDRRPDLIVLDLSLSYPDGLDTLEVLKSNDETRDVPIVIVTSQPLQLGTTAEVAVGEIVAKPFDIDRLLNVFRRALGDPEQDVPDREYGPNDTHLNSW